MAEQLAAAERQIEMGKQTVIAIARTVDAKDARTSEHSQRVAIYSGQIAKEYGMNEKQVRDIDVELEQNLSAEYYEVDFEQGVYEYEYRIEAFSGEILSAKRVRD